MIELSPGDILFDQPAADMEKQCEKEKEDRLRMWSSIELLRGGASADGNAKDARRERAQPCVVVGAERARRRAGLAVSPTPVAGCIPESWQHMKRLGTPFFCEALIYSRRP